VLALAIALLLTTQSEPLQTEEDYRITLFERVVPSVVYIDISEGFGTGFFLNNSGLILTNAHVVGGRKTVQVVLRDGTRIKGTVVESKPKGVDLALVQIERKNTPAATLGHASNLRVGSWVGAIGHGMGGVWSFVTGMVSNIYPDGKRRGVFQTQIPLNPGNSGGPIFDRHGQVVGIVTWGIEQSNSINFALRVEEIEHFARFALPCSDCLMVTVPKGAQVYFDGRLVGTGPQINLKPTEGAHDLVVSWKGKVKEVKFNYPEKRRVDVTF
jgi:serine protease Do